MQQWNQSCRIESMFTRWHVTAQGWTPLHVAAGHSSSQAHIIIDDLAQGGADLEATDREGRTPLLFALEGNRKEAIDALLHAGAF